MPATPTSRNPWPTIITAWLVAGTLDMSSALILFSTRTGKSPWIVCNYIASAAFGKEAAYGGGTPMVLAGLLFHYLIAFIFTVLFFRLYPWMHSKISNRFVWAFIYGIFVWCVMNLVVVPSSRIATPFKIVPSKAIEAAVILIVCIGLPLALIIHPYYFGKGSRKDAIV